MFVYSHTCDKMISKCATPICAHCTVFWYDRHTRTSTDWIPSHLQCVCHTMRLHVQTDSCQILVCGRTSCVTKRAFQNLYQPHHDFHCTYVIMSMFRWYLYNPSQSPGPLSSPTIVFDMSVICIGFEPLDARTFSFFQGIQVLRWTTSTSGRLSASIYGLSIGFARSENSASAPPPWASVNTSRPRDHESSGPLLHIAL